MNFTDVFGNDTLPPSEYGYASYTLTTNTAFQWPYNAAAGSFAVAKILEISCGPNVTMTMPDARQVSTGEDVLIRNTGSNLLRVKYPSGTQVHDIEPGTATYLYLTSNSTEDGEYKAIHFGVGTSDVDASTLVGYGIKAIGASLNQSHPVTAVAGAMNIDATYRAKVVVSTGGAFTATLDPVATLGNDFFVLIRNGGTGTLTLNPNGSETIDGQTSMGIQPGESLMLFCSGTAWFTVGYGRSVLYQFTQLIKDLSAGGTFTLTAAEASNKLLTFIGNPSAPVTVIVPAAVSVYYIFNSISTANNVTVKTASGSGAPVPQGQRVIAICDGTNVVTAQTIQTATALALVDGSSTTPSLNFSSQTNTGLYKFGADGIGITVNGVPFATFSTVTGAQIFGTQGYIALNTSVGAPAQVEGRLFYDNATRLIGYFDNTQLVLIPTVEGTQTFKNKTFNLSDNTLTGTLAQFNAACSDADFVSQTGAETLTNKTLTQPTITLKQSAAPTPTVEGDIQWDTDDNVLKVGDGSSTKTVPTTDSVNTLTNKTLDLANNTIQGTLAQFSTACTDADFASTSTAQTLTNKTISGTANTLQNIGNSSLVNSSFVINGVTVALGSVYTLPALPFYVTTDDLGSAPNEVPLNQYLGRLAFMDVVPFSGTYLPAATIASANTIAPLYQISFISGTTAINTITPPPQFVGGGQITLIPTGLWSTTTAGNIALATTAVVSKALILTYDATTAKWYPSY